MSNYREICIIILGGGELVMGVREDIKILLVKENLTLTNLADKLSKKYGKKFTADGISQKLRKGTMRYEEVKQIVDVLGYKIDFNKA